MSADRLPDCAEIYFHDGVTMGPMITMATVGDELPELIVGAFDALELQGLLRPTFGQVSAMLVFKAVATGNLVSLNPPPMRHGLGQQLSVLHNRDHAPGGIGTVVVDMVGQTVTTYGGRGFAEIAPGNPFAPNTFPLGLLAQAVTSGVRQEAAPAVKQEKPKKKRKAPRKKAKPQGDDTVSVG